MAPTRLASLIAPVADRQRAVSEIRRALSSPNVFGAVVVGKPGVGKSILLKDVLDETGFTELVIHIRGTSLSAGQPLSALAFLLNEFGLAADLQHSSIVESLTDHLQEMANGEQAIMVVDNADILDAESAEILAQLALNRSAKVLAACRDLLHCPPSFRTLWLEDALLRVDLDKLSLSEAQELLELALHGRVSRTAVLALWEDSTGNARLLQLLVHDFVASGKIVLHGDVWVLCRGALKVSQATADAVMAHLGPLTGRQMALLEVLALAGSVPLALIADLGSLQDLDRLRDAGAIDLERDLQQSVRPGRLVGAVVRERVGAFSRVQHLQRLEDAHTGDGPPPIDPVRYVEWLAECGRPVTAAIGLRGMTAANDDDDPETALRISAVLSADTGSGGSVGQERPFLLLETARARLGLEDDASAATVIEEFPAAARSLLTPQEMEFLQRPENQPVQVLIKVARALLSRHVSTPAEAANLPANAAAEHSIFLAKMERAASEGRYELVRGALEEGRLDWGSACPEMEIQRKALLAFTCAVTDRQHEALAFAGEVQASLQHLALSAPVRAHLLYRVELIHMITGYVHPAPGNPELGPQIVSADGTAGELTEGIVHALHGRADDALALLTSALAQLHMFDRFRLRPGAAAATAYCHALRGEFEKVRPLLSQLEAFEGAAQSGLPAFGLRYFRALTLALLGSNSEARRLLRDQAEQEREAGRFGLELIARSAVVRLGDRTAAPELLAAAGRTQGPFANLCTLIGGGLSSQKPELLLEAASTAEAGGNLALASDIRRLLHGIAVTSGDRLLTRKVQRGIARSGARPVQSIAGAQLNLLTPREREVANMAKSGLSNKEIAEQLHVSIRTVEGHLYQIYVKVGVGNRSDLLAALDGEAS